MQNNPDKIKNLPYGRPVDWDELSDQTKWLIIHHQLSTFSWWIRIGLKRR